MYLKRALNSFSRALLRCGISWGHGETGGCISSFSSSNFHWNFKELLRLHIGSIQKFSLAFSFPNFFPENLQGCFFRYLWSVLQPKVVKVFMIFHLATQISLFSNFLRANMKRTFDDSCSPWNLHSKSVLPISDFVWIPFENQANDFLKKYFYQK